MSDDNRIDGETKGFLIFISIVAAFFIALAIIDKL